jgi:hypothetical protein
VSRPPYPRQRPHPANRDPDSLPGRQGLLLCDVDVSLAQRGLVLPRRTLSDMHDPELRTLAGCRRPGLFCPHIAIAGRGESCTVPTLCPPPTFPPWGFKTGQRSLAPLRRGSLCAAEEAPAKGLTHRGLPASQTRRLIVSGSGVPPSATFARRCFETSFGAFGSRTYGRERLGLVVA